MAELKLNDLPVMNEVDFTDNDRFVIVDDGKARAMTKLVFQSWLTANVKGEKGEQGAAGSDGRNGANGKDGSNGKDGLSAYQIAVQNGYVGTQSQWLLSLKGAQGNNGVDGSNGWSPNFRVVARGEDSVLQLYDWIGGTGTKPTTTGYLSGTGVVSNIDLALDLRGAKGEKGDSGDVANVTPEDIKLKYESNPDTNVFTDSEKQKLSSIDVDSIGSSGGVVDVNGGGILKFWTGTNGEFLALPSTDPSTIYLVKEL